nr:MAG TPA: hypothetical protein [Caudoviricetes sp.]
MPRRLYCTVLFAISPIQEILYISSKSYVLI